MGYSSFEANNGFSVCAIARRQQIEGGQRQRYETILPPKAKVFYRIYADVFKGDWQNGLRMMFRDRYLYDLEKFDNTLYERPDLGWIKESYLIVLQMAWDREFFDRLTGKYTFPEVRKGNKLSAILMFSVSGQHGRDSDLISAISGTYTGTFRAALCN
jgi:hypothetical protein